MPRDGDAIIGAALDGLRRAAHEVEVERSVTTTLQHSLLRERLPDIPGMSFSARYLPGSAEAEIGGDWYDVIPLRDGKAGLVIGDVVGRGIAAAARMAHLQSAVRAYALEGLRPSVVLERTDAFAQELERRGMATMLYAVLDPEAGTLRYASAGHPPPLIIPPDREVAFAEGRSGSPLGTVTFPSYEESVVPLEPGSAIVMYTDGLVERPAVSLAEGLEALGEAAADLDTEPGELCRVLPGRVLEGRSGDDIAILAIRLEHAARRPRAALAAGGVALASGASPRPRPLAEGGGSGGDRDLRDPRRGRRGVRQRDRSRVPGRRGRFRGRGDALGLAARDHGARLRQLAARPRRGAPPRPDADGAADGARHDRQGRDRDHGCPPAQPAEWCVGMRDRLSQVEFEEREGVLIARVSGEVDGSNTVELGRALGEKLPSSAHGLVLDLSGIAYLDSAGIELLFSLARRLGDRRQRLRLSVPQQSPVRKVLEICDIGSVAPMEETAEIAAERIADADA